MDEAALRVSVVGRVMAAYEVHALVLSSFEYVTLCGKREFADVIKLRVLRWGQYPGVIRCVQCSYKSTYKTEAGGSVRNVVTEVEVGVMRGREPRNRSDL